MEVFDLNILVTDFMVQAIIIGFLLGLIPSFIGLGIQFLYNLLKRFV